MIFTIFDRNKVHKSILMYAKSNFSNFDKSKFLPKRVLLPIEKLVYIYSILMCSSILCSLLLAEEVKVNNNNSIVVNGIRNSLDTKRVIISPQKGTNNQDVLSNQTGVASDATKKRMLPQIKALTNKDNLQESPAPSTLSSIYDYINNRWQQQQQESKQPATTRVFPMLGTAQNFQQFAQSQDYNHHQKPVALGRENDASSLIISHHKQSSPLDDSEFIRPLLGAANRDGLQSPINHNHLLINKQHLYSKPIALQSSEEHILSDHNNNISGYQPQPQIIKMMPVQNNHQQQHVYPRNVVDLQNYKTTTQTHHRGEDVYEAEKNPYKQKARQNFYQNSPRKGLDFAQRETEYKENINKRRFSPLLKEKHIVRDELRGKIYPDTTKLNERQKLLSNEQLASLIDELKEFNDRQANKMQPGGFVPPMALMKSHKIDKRKRGRKQGSPGYKNDKYKGLESESNSDETEDSPEYSEKNEDKTSERDSERHKRISNNRRNNMSTDDLAKFAKFLMSKEGSNLKFQLGLDKETIDDGDFDDEKDALLESNEKQTKTKFKRIPPSGMETLDKKYKEVAENMDKMYNGLGNKAKDAENELAKRLMSEKLKRKRQLDKANSNKARKRRDRKESSASSGDSDAADEQQESLANDQEGDSDGIRSSPKEANFAKLLINQEILEDQRDSAQDPPTSSSKRVEKSGKQEHSHDSPNHLGKNSRTLIDVDAESSLPKVQTEYGEEEDQYPVNERFHDHSNLLNDLQKARRTKSKTRSRIPMPVDSLLKRALDGDLGLRTEKRSDGKLLLKDTTRGNVAVLDLPPKNGDSGDSEQTVKSNEDDGSSNSELIPSHQINSDQHDGSLGSSNVLIQSSQPVKDEYPISERVSAGLNKLSNNLDRYFNDGFLAEIETKSKEGVNQNGRSNNNNNNLARNKESHQPESSNVNEAARQVVVDEIQKGTDRKLEDDSKDEVEKKIKGKVDHDFDVDVSIDGKKDNDRDDESDKSDDLDTKDDDNERSNNSKRKKVKLLRNRKMKLNNNELKRVDSLPRSSNNSKNNNNNKRVKGKLSKEITNKKNLKEEKRPPVTDNADGSRSVSRDMTTRSEKVEFENLGRIAPNLDPVESENLETPIGPDPDTGVEADILSKQKTKSTKGTEVSSTYGKKVPGKFYEEPEWR